MFCSETESVADAAPPHWVTGGFRFPGSALAAVTWLIINVTVSNVGRHQQQYERHQGTAWLSYSLIVGDQWWRTWKNRFLCSITCKRWGQMRWLTHADSNPTIDCVLFTLHYSLVPNQIVLKMTRWARFLQNTAFNLLRNVRYQMQICQPHVKCSLCFSCDRQHLCCYSRPTTTLPVEPTPSVKYFWVFFSVFVQTNKRQRRSLNRTWLCSVGPPEKPPSHC